MLDIEEIRPRAAENGSQNPIYISRVSSLLPNFPNEVLGSWFSDHLGTVDDFFPLGLENLRFQQKRLFIEDIGGQAVFRHGSRSVKALLDDMPIAHLRLKKYWDENGIWPVPPILLDVNASVIPPSFEQKLQSPYHLLEGYHRMALAITADIETERPMQRDFWIVHIVRPATAPVGANIVNET